MPTLRAYESTFIDDGKRSFLNQTTEFNLCLDRRRRRDRQMFAAMLDDESTKPNDALVKAAKRYKKQID